MSIETKTKSFNLSKEELTKIKVILEDLEKDKHSDEFLEAVDYIRLGLDDYPIVIKVPMDLGTVKTNLKHGKYNSVGDVISDIDLIWKNCMTYNIEGSEIYRMAEYMQKLTNRLVEKSFKNLHLNKIQPETNGKSTHITGNSVKKANLTNPDFLQVSLEDKILLNSKVNSLKENDLETLIRFIHKDYPIALEDVDETRIQVRLEFLSKEAFAKVNKLVSELQSKVV